MHDPILSSASPDTLLDIIDKAEIDPAHESSAQSLGEDEAARAYWESGTTALGKDGLGLTDGEVALVVNGRVSELIQVESCRLPLHRFIAFCLGLN